MDNSTSFKSGFVTIIGRPNVGKSTLMNQMIGQKIAITSKKPQTTRSRIQTVYTDMERGQIVFLDTPGIHKAKNKLGEYMVNAAEHTLQDADVILWLVEPSDFVGAGEQHIAQILQKVKLPVILVINKIDTVAKKENLLHFIDTYRKIYLSMSVRGQTHRNFAQPKKCAASFRSVTKSFSTIYPAIGSISTWMQTNR